MLPACLSFLALRAGCPQRRCELGRVPSVFGPAYEVVAIDFRLRQHGAAAVRPANLDAVDSRLLAQPEMDDGRVLRQQ